MLRQTLWQITGASLLLLAGLNACGRLDNLPLSPMAASTEAVDSAAANRLALQRGTEIRWIPADESSESSTSKPDETLPEDSPQTKEKKEARSTQAKTPQKPVKTNPNLPKAPGFELQDQSGKTHKVKFPRDKVTVLALADQEGSKQMEHWIKPLYARYTEQIYIEGIAELTAVPAFARSIAKSIISKQVERQILLDWEGRVTKKMAFVPKQTNLVVIDTEGYIHYKTAGTASIENYRKVEQAIGQLLEAD